MGRLVSMVCGRYIASRNALDPTEAVMIRGKGFGSFQPLGYLIITASVEGGIPNHTSNALCNA